MPRPHYFCHISLMVLSTAALAAPLQGTAPTPPSAESARTGSADAAPAEPRQG